jgi:hypothetical protein
MLGICFRKVSTFHYETVFASAIRLHDVAQEARLRLSIEPGLRGAHETVTLPLPGGERQSVFERRDFSAQKLKALPKESSFGSAHAHAAALFDHLSPARLAGDALAPLQGSVGRRRLLVERAAQSLEI